MRAAAVVHENPTHGYQPVAAFVPMGRSAHHGDFPLTAPIPSDPQPPATLGGGHHLGRRRLFGAFLAWPSVLLAAHHRRRSIHIGVGVEVTDQRQVLAMAMGEAGQRMGAKAAVPGKHQFSLGKPVDQHGQHLPHQLRRRLVPPPMLAIPFRRAIQRDQDRQRPGTVAERELNQDRQDDPLVSPTVRRIGMGGTHGIAMTGLAINVLAAVLSSTVSSPAKGTSPSGSQRRRMNAASPRATRQLDQRRRENTR